MLACCMPAMACALDVDGDCVSKFQDMCKQDKHRFIIISFEASNYVVAETIGSKAGSLKEDLDTLCEKLPGEECRYAVFQYEGQVGFFHWEPEYAGECARSYYSAADAESLRTQLEEAGGMTFAVKDKPTSVDEIQQHTAKLAPPELVATYKKVYADWSGDERGIVTALGLEGMKTEDFADEATFLRTVCGSLNLKRR